MCGSVKYITEFFLNRMMRATRQNGNSGLPRLKKQMVIDAIQAHFFASLNFIPAMKQRAETARKDMPKVTFSVSVFVLISLNIVRGISENMIIDSIHSSIEQYLIPLVGGCLNSFISS